MPDVAALVVAMSAQLTQFEKDITKANDIAKKGVDDIEKKFNGMNIHVGGLNEFASKLTNILTIGGIIETIRQLGELNAAVAKIGDTAEVLGTTSDYLQRLQYAAVLTGSSTDKMNGFLDAFNRKVGEAATGTGLLYQQLRVNGIEADKFAKLPLSDQLKKFADLITGIRDPAQQFNLFAEASSRNFSELIPLFRRGADGLQDFTDRAEEIGPIMDKALIEKAKETNIQYQTLIVRLKLFWEQFAIDAAKAGNTVAKQSEENAREVQGYYEAALKWLKENFPASYAVIASSIEGVTNDLKQKQADISTAASKGGGRPTGIGSEMTPEEVSKRLTAENYDYSNRKLIEYGQTIAKTTTLFNEQNQAYLDILQSERKKIELSQAEADNQGKTVEAATTYTTAIQLQNEVLARNKNITLDQLLGIQKVAVEMGKQAKATDEAKRNWAGLNSAVQFAGNEMIDVLTGLANKTLTFASAAEQLKNSLVKALLQAAVLGSGPLANVLGFQTNIPGGTGGLGGLLVGAIKSISPARQSGGPVVGGGSYVVGEHGTELFVPNSSGTIVPGSVSRGGSGGSQITINNYAANDTQINQRKQSDPVNGERYIIDIVKKAQSRGDFDDSQRGRFALRPQKVR